ncbi:hypothetical protein IAR55_001110 [Kwoniella newhampshirensis]|uniref:Uncharacterized protein n=1 Tax=Kwoniella newhampshirensis TaxID=1651941 RepID=A0AAW0Z4S4_9TREE
MIAHADKAAELESPVDPDLFLMTPADGDDASVALAKKEEDYFVYDVTGHARKSSDKGDVSIVSAAKSSSKADGATEVDTMDVGLVSAEYPGSAVKVLTGIGVHRSRQVAIKAHELREITTVQPRLDCGVERELIDIYAPSERFSETFHLCLPASSTDG